MKKIKDFLKKHKFKFLVFIVLLLGTSVGVLAVTIYPSSEVTYDNTSSGMTSTNVQDAIDELDTGVNSCAVDLLPNNKALYALNAEVVTSGDGLYKDTVEPGRYVYKGANPNNYICLDTNSSGSCSDADLYRIIAIETNGTLKVIKNTSLGDMVWDPGYSTSGTPSGKSASSINGTRKIGTSTGYCYASSDSSYYGCKSWGSRTSTYDSTGTTKVTVMPWQAGSSTTKTLPLYDSYLNVYLNGGQYLTTSSSGNSTTSQTITGWISSQNSVITNNIVDYAYNVGPLKSSSGQTTSTDVSQESAYKWIGKVALMNASDYVRASTNSSCTGAYAYYNTSGCYSNSSTHNWLFNSANQRTLSPHSTSTAYIVWNVNSGGNITGNSANGSRGVRPVLHLKSGLTYSGTGTSTDPYEISGTLAGSGTVVYAYHTDQKTIGTSTITNGVSNYTQLSSYQNGTKWFLKYEIDSSNVIQKAWSCMKYDFISAPVCLQGANPAVFSANKTILSNLASTFSNNSGNCSIGNTSADCWQGGTHIYAGSDGLVNTNDGDYPWCAISAAGQTICEE